MLLRFCKFLPRGIVVFQLLAFVALMVGLLVQPFSPVVAQGTETAPGVDVLFLVDQSGSMGGLAAGSTAHSTPNDSLGLRFEAPQAFAQLLAEDRLQVHPNGLHRVALIYFGDTVDPRLGWTDIAPTSWEELQAQMNSLKSENGGLAAGRYATNNLGNTDFLKAFDSASQLFATLPAGETNRQRVLIVLTDGQPCVPPPATPTPASGTPTATPGGYMSPCLYAPAHMQNLVSKSASFFPANQYKIFVVAMNDSTDNYWPGMKDYWEKISSNRARKVSTNADVSRLFYDVWKELSSSLPKPEGDRHVTVNPVSPGPVVVPPYLDTITFTLFKKRPEETLQVYDVSDNLITDDMPDVEVSGENILKVKVFRPLPGRWRVSTTGSTDNVDIEMRAVAAEGRLISPRGTQVQYVPSNIEWQLLDSRGQPLPDYGEPQYRLEPLVTITAEGDTAPLQLQYRGNSIYAAEFTPVMVGNHIVSMEAVARDDDDNQIVVFRGAVGRFSVGAVSLQPVDIPSTVSEFSPLTLTYELRDTGGRPVSLKSSANISVTLSTAVSTATVLLKPRADGRFTGEYVPVEAGEYAIAIAAVLTDVKGNTRVLASGSGGSFMALPPSLKPESPVGPQAQYLPLKVRYQVIDGNGNEFQLVPGYQMVFTATMQLADKLGQMLTLQEVMPGTFEASYTPDEQGSYQLFSVANIQAPDLKSYRVGSHQAQVTVIPTTRVGIKLVHPDSSELSQFSRTFALDPRHFFSAPKRLPIEVHLVGDGDKLLDPREVFGDNSTVPIEISLLGTTTKKSEDAGLRLTKTDVPGIYRAESVGLRPGSYDLKAVLPSTVKTKPAYTIPGEGSSVQATVLLRENWFWVGMWVLIAFVIAAFIFLLTGGPKGSLALVDSTNPNIVLAGPWRLRGSPRWVKLSNKTLDQYDIRSIRISRGRPIDPDIRQAINVSARDNSGAEFYSGSLDGGDQIPFVPGADIQYNA